MTLGQIFTRKNEVHWLDINIVNLQEKLFRNKSKIIPYPRFSLNLPTFAMVMFRL